VTQWRYRIHRSWVRVLAGHHRVVSLGKKATGTYQPPCYLLRKWRREWMGKIKGMKNKPAVYTPPQCEIIDPVLLTALVQMANGSFAERDVCRKFLVVSRTVRRNVCCNIRLSDWLYTLRKPSSSSLTRLSLAVRSPHPLTYICIPLVAYVSWSTTTFSRRNEWRHRASARWTTAAPTSGTTLHLRLTSHSHAVQGRFRRSL